MPLTTSGAYGASTGWPACSPSRFGASPGSGCFSRRDRFGKKPLVLLAARRLAGVCVRAENPAGGSGVPRIVDPDVLRLYLRFGYVPTPLTILKDARKLPPCHYAVFERGVLSIERYWDPVTLAISDRLSLSSGEADAELEARLKTAVAGRMISEVPLGAFLSGGHRLVAARRTVHDQERQRANPAVREQRGLRPRGRDGFTLWWVTRRIRSP